jgi:hypothetical protein
MVYSSGITLPGFMNLSTVYAENTGNINISSQLEKVEKYVCIPIALSFPTSKMKRIKVVITPNPLHTNVACLVSPVVRTPIINGRIKPKINRANMKE